MPHYHVETVVPKGEKRRWYSTKAASPEEASAEVERIEQGLADAAPANGSKVGRVRRVGTVTKL